MNIIIVGCGKVGWTLAEQLCNEEHQVVVIDTNSVYVYLFRRSRFIRYHRKWLQYPGIVRSRTKRGRYSDRGKPVLMS